MSAMIDPTARPVDFTARLALWLISEPDRLEAAMASMRGAGIPHKQLCDHVGETLGEEDGQGESLGDALGGYALRAVDWVSLMFLVCRADELSKPRRFERVYPFTVTQVVTYASSLSLFEDLMERSVWFEVTPLPDGLMRITAKTGEMPARVLRHAIAEPAPSNAPDQPQGGAIPEG